MKDLEYALFVIASIFCIGLMVMLMVEVDDNKRLKKQAVEKGYAQYDSQTGKWGWKK